MVNTIEAKTDPSAVQKRNVRIESSYSTFIIRERKNLERKNPKKIRMGSSRLMPCSDS